MSRSPGSPNATARLTAHVISSGSRPAASAAARTSVEPAHREAYVDLGPGGQIDATQWQLADEALRSWRDAQGIEDKQLTLTPEDLGVRITYLATPPITDTSVPDCDFAVPFA
jgi:hypothetical protein